jgi:hypothetical protein
LINKIAQGLRDSLRRRALISIKAAQCGGRKNLSRSVIGTRNGNLPNAVIADKQPIREIPFLVDNPNDGIEERLRRCSCRSRSCLMREQKGTSKRLVFRWSQNVVPDQHARREINDDREGITGLYDGTLHNFGKKFETSRRRCVRTRLQLELRQELDAGTRIFAWKELGAKTRYWVIDEGASVACLMQSIR